MNLCAVLLLFVAAVVAVVLGIPATDDLSLDQLRTAVWEEVEELEVPVAEEEESGVRVRRATCDLLSVSLPIGSLNHAACAAHCLSKRRGYKGGRCKDGVCHCRK